MSTNVIISGAKLRKYLSCVRLPFMDEFADRTRAISPSQPVSERDSGHLRLIVQAIEQVRVIAIPSVKF